MPLTGDVFTYAYKYVDGLPVHIDVYPPPQAAPSEIVAPLPAVIYFHGGALTVGNRRSWFPTWLHSEYLFPLSFIGNVQKHILRGHSLTFDPCQDA